MEKPDSPRILACSWGRLEVEGGLIFKDAMLYPGGAEEWDWRVNATGHEQGIQAADVEYLIERGADGIILSQGMNRRLGVSPGVKALLTERRIPYAILPTEEAVERYNGLAKRGKPGALMHTTC